jgi:hypothetical protein
VQLSPDGLRYLRARPPRPFVWRWFLPTVTGRDADAWRIVSWVSLGLLGPAVWAWSGDWRTMLFLPGLAGVLHVNVRFPVLTDPLAMLCAVTSATMVGRGWWAPAVLLALVAGATNERAPVFAALFAWHPVPLLGLVAVGWALKPGPDPCGGPAADALVRPLQTAWAAHRALPLWVWVLPWGAGVAAVAAPSWQLAATAAVAYAMCVVATDTVRLYQWSWPVAAVCALEAIPAEWLAVVLVLHVVNPFRTEGV